jgi:hypothetical protein
MGRCLGLDLVSLMCRASGGLVGREMEWTARRLVGMDGGMDGWLVGKGAGTGLDWTFRRREVGR